MPNNATNVAKPRTSPTQRIEFERLNPNVQVIVRHMMAEMEAGQQKTET